MVGQPYVRNAGDADVLEVAAIQLLDRSPEVGSRLKLNEAKTRVSGVGLDVSAWSAYPSLLPLRFVSE
jgi:hypothetical protein